MAKLTELTGFIRKQPRWRIVVAVLAVFGLILLLRGGGKTTGEGATFTARRGPLDITVIEGGSLQALESQEIKCEVRVGYQGTKILKIVEEGYQVTDEDVANGKVLVELDSSEIQKQLVQQEIQLQSSSAAFTDAQQTYEIQLNQNVSDIKAAEQKARFARMDFDKFLGSSLTDELIERHALDKPVLLSRPKEPLLPAPTNAPAGNPPVIVGGSEFSRLLGATSPGQTNTTSKPPTPSSPVPASANPVSAPAPDVQPSPKPVEIDFLQYATLEALGIGEAKQKLRKMEDDLQVAKKELGQSQSTIDGTRRLHEKGFVTRTDLQRDEIAFENSRLKVQTAETARDLYLKYEFVKSAEESLSKFTEAVRELDRARKAAVSKLAQAESKLRSTEAQFNIQSRQRKDMAEQIVKCVIKATKPGLVVYGGGREDVFYSDQERIREGATVRERQAIITIPNLAKMSVNVKIHESYIKKIIKGQKARIVVDAFADQALKGEITKVAVLPDSANRWMNPDLKVYLTTITIEGSRDWVKPGMSAKVEVFVEHLDDVVHVPVQAIIPEDGKHFCYVMNGRSQEKRIVEIGQFNDEFIVVRGGLKEGEKVVLRSAESLPDGGGAKPAKNTEEPPKPANAAGTKA